VSECDRETLTMKRLWPTRGFCAMGGGGFVFLNIVHEVNALLLLSLKSLFARRKCMLFVIVSHRKSEAYTLTVLRKALTSCYSKLSF
jgi:heme exporter protein D